MRLRFAVLAAMVTALVALVMPGVGTAAPRHDRGITINATPNPILAGEDVFIYGQLNNPPVGGQAIILYHHVAGTPGYTRVGSTTTLSNGFYEFTRAEDVVMTNRDWFVREAGIHGVHSRTVRERVEALVSLSASQTSQVTRKPVVFTGHVTPNHSFERVYLQDQVGSSDVWYTLTSGLLGPGSNYSIPYRFRFPGVYSVRVIFRGDFRNVRGEANPVTVTIQQAQVPDFTINSSDPITQDANPVTISGLLDEAGTTTPEPGTDVTLFARTAGTSSFVPVAEMPTNPNGTYSFNEMPSSNTIYQVRTTFAPRRHSAELYQGVQDVLTLGASSSTSMTGQTVTLMGTVLPDKSGDVVYLQRLGKDGFWHNVEVGFVRSNSSFEFSWTFGNPGPHVFRARIPGDPENVGGASPAVSISVALAPPSSLAPGS